MRIALWIGVTVLCLGCGPTTPTTPAKAPPPRPVDVSWRTMVRDRATVTAYLNQRVRFRAIRGDIVRDGSTIRLWYADRRQPPTIIITCPDPLPDSSDLQIVGVVTKVEIDGIKRSLWIDYYVEIAAIRVTGFD